MTAARRDLGRAAEDAVAARLAELGMRVLDRNVRVAGIRGELDLVALDRDRTLVFVEVKGARPGTLAGPERPALAVGPRKRAKIRALARAWLASGTPVPRFRAIRFDVVGLRLDHEGRVTEWDHIAAAF